MSRGWAGSLVLVGLVGLLACGDDDTMSPVDGGGDAAACTDDSCDDGLFCNGPESCVSGTCAAGSPPCGAGMTCDDISDSCSGTCDVPDADGDGADSIACGGDDCDDDDPDRFPGNEEVCDAEGHDEDCDGATLGGRDVDRDGFVSDVCCNDDVCGLDCADGIGAVHPDAAEVCNLRDDDCDGAVDEGTQVEAHADADRDLYGADEVLMVCAGTAGTSGVPNDCDDSDPDRNRAVPEICDGEDNDCDDIVDEDAVDHPWYPDTDGDGYGDADGDIVLQCGRPDGYSLRASDCDDSDAARSPGADELCNALDDDCDGIPGFEIAPGDTEDDDRDGFADATCGSTDCDDLDPYVYVGAPELADDVDNDCDGTIDEDVTEVDWYSDADEDGGGDATDTPVTSSERQAGRVIGGGDCDDADATVTTTAREVCDGIDNDCDDTIDEGTRRSAWYRDEDGDGFGDPTMVTLDCAQPDGYAASPSDCDDGDAMRFPGATELCDDVDQDCDARVDEGAVPVDWYVDFDGDGYGTGAVAMSSCVMPVGHALRDGDCADMNASINPGATEICDGVNDEDCDENVDEGLTSIFYRDMDGDGAGDPSMTMTACSAPSGFVSTMNDCDDDDGANFPGNPEVCDMANNDCDGATDEGLPTAIYYRDMDGDGYAPTGAGSLIRCAAPDGYTADLGDCDDGLPSVNPDGTEVCNGLDDDCSTVVDDGVAAMCSPAIHPDLTGACEMPPAAAGTCDCVSATADECDGNPVNGCEDLMTDVDHCGACNDPCPDARYCAAGSCTYAPITALTGGVSNSCVIRGTNVVQCWGTNRTTFQGPGSFGTATRVLEGFEVVHFATSRYSSEGLGHGCFAALNGTGGNDLYCWGYDSEGQTGDGAVTPARNEVPTRILASVDDVVEDWAEVVLSGAYSVARTASGSVWAFGTNSSGQLGSDTGGAASPVPLQVAGIDDAVQISAGFSHACAVRASGQVWCWGSDSFNRCGNGVVRRDGPTPRPVVFDMGGEMPLQNVAQVAAHDDGGCARKTDGTVWCWGAGTLGNGSTGTTGVAVQVTISGATDLTCSGRPSCCAVTGGGIVQCWGNFNGGTHGNNATTANPTPVNVVLGAGPTPLTGVTEVHATNDVMCGLVPAPMNDRVVCWGNGTNGRLGDGNTGTHTRLNAGAPDFVMGL